MRINLYTLVKSILIMGLDSALIYYYLHPQVKKCIRWYTRRLQKKEGIDVLKVNRMLTFGISSVPCPGHTNTEFDCGNIDCNYGRLSYMLSFIHNSTQSVAVCIYIITAKLFGDAIIAAHKRGVKVRIIADSDMAFSVQSYINVFRKHAIPTRQRMSPYIMHHKFVIVDEKVLISGSMNFTMTGAFCNWENVLITSQPQLVEQFCNTFEGLWEEFGMPVVAREMPANRRQRQVRS